MGFDYLDFQIRLEKKLGICQKGSLIPTQKTRPSRALTVGDLESLYLKAYRQQKPALQEKIWTSGEIECAGCHFTLEDSPIPGFCRSCGTPVTLDEYLVGIFRRCLNETLSVSIDCIYAEARLVRDLKMS